MIRRILPLAVLLLTLALPLSGAAERKAGPPSAGAVSARGPVVVDVAPGGPTRPDRETLAEGGAVPEYRLAEGGQDRALLWDGMRMALSLAAVLLLLGLGVTALRRWPVLAGRSAAAGPLEVLGRLPVGTKEAVCVVRAGNEVLALGISAAGVNFLCRLEPTALGVQPSVPGTQIAAGLGGAAQPIGRRRELAARLREVQAAWGLPRADAEGRR